MIIATPEARQLLHDGCVAFSQVERNGMRVDVDYLSRTIEKTDDRIRRLKERLQDHKVYRVWRRRFGSKSNLGSRMQLGAVLFEELGYECKTRTKTEKYKITDATLSAIDNGFVKGFLKLEKLKKTRNTYLSGIQREVRGDRIYPTFNLHIARTYRSSSDHPNFQNFPIRDPEQGKLIRQCFIPSKGHVLCEIDYGGIEVHAASWYHKDPRMLDYLADPSKDMHRDMAAQCYKVEPSDVSKKMRHCGKNQFVFPQFYGDYYINNAKDLWHSIGLYDFQHVRDNFQELGPCDPTTDPRPGTFEHHIKQVERDFWNKRFLEYGRWKLRWWEQYLREGLVRMLTGFVVSGLYGKNDIINYPIQGVAFHCLLWSLIRLQRWLRKHRMRSMIVGQIHDSIVGDIHESELEDYLQRAKEVMTEEIRRAWQFIITDLEVEAEISDKTWFDKVEVQI